MPMVPNSTHLIAFCMAILLSAKVLAATSPPTPQSPLPQMGQAAMDELQKPEYSLSRCMLSPVIASDGISIAIGDRIFATGDTLLEVGGEKLDLNEKNPLRTLLLKHGPDDTLQVKLRRADKEMLVTAKCTDAKPFYDAILEAAYAASKNDAAACVDKLQSARQTHPLYAPGMNLMFQCARIAGKLNNAADFARSYYEIGREMIIENAYSADALGRIRGTILTAVEALRKPNLSPLLGDDLKAQYDQALSARAQPVTVALGN